MKKKTTAEHESDTIERVETEMDEERLTESVREEQQAEESKPAAHRPRKSGEGD